MTDAKTLIENVSERLAAPTFLAAAQSIEIMQAAGIDREEALLRVGLLVAGMRHMAEFDKAMVTALEEDFSEEKAGPLLVLAQKIALDQFDKIVGMVEVSYPGGDDE